ncbi:hypothetical protein TSOC111612_11455 [Tsukamurella ocularis]|uniref:recombinase family protein n=1 Tax=Tsukamurella ocularis TaxID=1970234 RepID=UPI0039EF182D
MSTYGYARVSTDNQTVEAQVHALVQAGVDADYIYSETASGSGTPKRLALREVLDVLVDGDELVIVALDRLARDVRTSAALITDLTQRGVTVRSLRDGVDSSTPAGRMVMSVVSAVAEYEWEVQRERRAAARESRRARGLPTGRPPALTREQQTQLLRDHQAGDPIEVLEARYAVSSRTIYRVLADARECELDADRDLAG